MKVGGKRGREKSPREVLISQWIFQVYPPTRGNIGGDFPTWETAMLTVLTGYKNDNVFALPHRNSWAKEPSSLLAYLVKEPIDPYWSIRISMKEPCSLLVHQRNSLCM